MAIYTNGSSGTEVKKLQEALINAGYDVGSTGADGIYGSNTAAAVRKYQQDNGLSVDGIAGDQTLGKLYSSPAPNTGTTTGQTNTTPENTTPEAPDYSQYAYDASSDAAYQQALAALQQAQKTQPTYAGTYDQQLQDIYDQIVNREKFSYDMNADAFYQQYADQYTRQGELAMMDTMGQAAAMTGGYGNSYAQTVGQQTYQEYLQQLNEVVPELYGMALDQYNAEGEQLYNQFAMTGDLADTEYGRYQDALNQYWQNVSYLKGEADDAYNRGYNEWYSAYQMGSDAENTAYNRQQDSYNKLVTLITTTGYTPSAQELQAAGMSSGEAQAYANYYAQQQAAATASRSSGGGGSSSGSSGNTTPEPAKEPEEEPYNIEEDLNHFISQGASKSEINTFLRNALKSGVITTAQYNSLKKTYAPAGNTY